jgi:hypothetical protein
MCPALLPEIIFDFREVVEVVPAVHVIRFEERSISVLRCQFLRSGARAKRL